MIFLDNFKVVTVQDITAKSTANNVGKGCSKSDVAAASAAFLNPSIDLCLPGQGLEQELAWLGFAAASFYNCVSALLLFYILLQASALLLTSVLLSQLVGPLKSPNAQFHGTLGENMP